MHIKAEMKRGHFGVMETSGVDAFNGNIPDGEFSSVSQLMQPTTHNLHI